MILASVSLTLLLLLAACSGSQTGNVDTAVAATVAAIQTHSAEVTPTPVPTDTSVPNRGDFLYSEADLAAFEAAFDSGDYEQVRALFTEDGVITTMGDIHSAYFGDTVDFTSGRVDGPEFRRLATMHYPSDFIILGEPIQVGDNSVAFGWTWAYGISGTAILYLRDGKIVLAVLNPAHPQAAPLRATPTAMP